MRQVGQLQHQGIAGGVRLGRLLVERGDFFAQVLGLRFFGLGLGEFFLAHERANFLAHAVAQGLERFHFGQEFPALFIQLEQFVNLRLVPCPARGEARADEIGFFADQFDVEHAANLRNAGGSRKAEGGGSMSHRVRWPETACASALRVTDWRKVTADQPAPFLRLFLALAVPPAVREEIGRAQGRLQRHSPPGAIRWTRSDQFHVTLKFLGDVPAEQVAALEQCVAPICTARPALPLSARGIGFFPGTHQPRVIWAGAGDGRGQLSALHRQIDEALRWLAPAERPGKFTGHITLGRFKPGRHAAIPKLLELAAGYRDQHFGDWRAEAVELVRSELTSTGAEHTVMAAFPLAG